MKEPKTNNQAEFIYGIHAVEEILKNHPERIDRIWFQQNVTSGPLFNLLKSCRSKRVPYQTVPTTKLNSLAKTQKNQGVVAMCPAVPFADIEEIINNTKNLKTPPIFLVAASVEDPGNLGAIIRSAAAFGVNCILLERKNTVPINATVAKASTGMIEYVPIAKPRNLENVIRTLRDNGFSVIGASHYGQNEPNKVNMNGPVVIIMGGENRGIPPYLRKLCTDTTAIPSRSVVSSLNVSVATSILLYECVRQRDYLSLERPS